MSTDQIREYFVGEFRGDFPDVPIAAGVNMDALKETDAAPFFVTLPVIPEVGAISKNGLLYDDNLVNSIEEQINRKRPGGIFGHLRDDQRDTAFPIPEGMWVGAQRVGKALWAKAYIPPGAARDHMRRLKALGGQIATSIYGKGSFEGVREGVRRLKDFNLESLDFAPPERAALGAGATPFVTAEFEQGDQPSEDLNMPTREEVIAGLTAGDVPAQVREQIIREAQPASDPAIVQELADMRTLNQTLTTRLSEMQVREFESALDVEVSKLINWQVKGEDAQKAVDAFKRTLRSHIISEFGTERPVERIAEIAGKVWEDLKPLAETLRNSLAGPPAIIPQRTVTNGRPVLVDTPEARQAARARLGI